VIPGRDARSIRRSDHLSARVPRWLIEGRVEQSDVPGGAARLARPAREIGNLMKLVGALLAWLTLGTGCAALSGRAAADESLCSLEPTDQVERRASREICR
jgi:hypothetical protein